MSRLSFLVRWLMSELQRNTDGVGVGQGTYTPPELREVDELPDQAIAAAFRDVAARNYSTCYASLFRAHVIEKARQLAAGVPVVDPTRPPLSVLHGAIVDALMHHSMCHTVEDEENALTLVDMLTPRGDEDITRGKEEIERLADAIFDAVEPFAHGVVLPDGAKR